MKNIVFISIAPYGKLLDYHMYITKSSENINNVYYFYSPGTPLIRCACKNTSYFSIKLPKGPKFITQLLFAFKIIRMLKKSSFDLIIVEYFKYAFLIRIFLRKNNFLLDIRTGSVSIRFSKWKNLILKINSLFFKNISILSYDLGRKLLDPKPFYYLPLGGYYFNKKSAKYENEISRKNFSITEDDFVLLYVGTFFNRQLEKTILGFKEVLKKIKFLKYFIIGFGEEKNKLQDIINKNSLNNNILILDYIPIENLAPYFKIADIGISFVPIIDEFDLQLPTKTFDYLVNGLPVLATKTTANKSVVNKINGILIDDTSKSFASGLEKMISAYNNFNFNLIKENSKQYRWEAASLEFQKICNNLSKI